MGAIAENIKNFRIFRGIKQQELATLLGKSKSVISNWERGENCPDVEICEKLCRILKVTPNELFGWENNREYESYLAELERTSEKLNKLIQQRNALNKEIYEMSQKFKESIPAERFNNLHNLDEQIDIQRQLQETYENKISKVDTDIIPKDD